jgi:Lrp/AsnC family transcriptional regulator for asnA, asnC and gidA
VVEALRQIPEVTECHFTTGGCDLFIKLYAKNNHHMLNIIHDKLQPLGLSRSETIVSLNVPIDRQLPIMSEEEEMEDEMEKGPEDELKDDLDYEANEK